MALVPVRELIPGVKLSQDVYTPLGGLLFLKGKVLLPRDMDILQAFMIAEVGIESRGQSSEGRKIEAQILAAGSKESILPEAAVKVQASSAKESSLHDEYDKLLSMIKSTYQEVVSPNFSIYELRNQLENTIAYLKDYHILMFVPRAMNEYDYMYHNAVLSSLSSYLLAKWVGLPQKDWMQVAFAGLLHDIGNIKIDPAILYKPSPLTSAEIEEVRLHTHHGYQLLKNVTGINEGVRLAALQHHEKVDCTGYPLGLEGSKIHMYAKIVAVVDIFHAMTLNRAYSKAQSPYKVLEQIHSEAFGKLDPFIVKTFIQKVTEFHNGMIVKLSNEQIGEIVFTDRDHPTRPMVSVQGEIVNLMQQSQLYIMEVIS